MVSSHPGFLDTTDYCSDGVEPSPVQRACDRVLEIIESDEYPGITNTVSVSAILSTDAVKAVIAAEGLDEVERKVALGSVLYGKLNPVEPKPRWYREDVFHMPGRAPAGTLAGMDERSPYRG